MSENDKAMSFFPNAIEEHERGRRTVGGSVMGRLNSRREDVCHAFACNRKSNVMPYYDTRIHVAVTIKPGVE